MRHAAAAGCDTCDNAACGTPRGKCDICRTLLAQHETMGEDVRITITRHRAMTAKHIPITEAARLYGVDRRTIQRKVAKGELERVSLKGGKVGVTVRSLEAAYGIVTAPATEPEMPQRQGATPATMPHAARRAASATSAAPEAAETREKLAAADALIAELRATLDHERTDREKERAAWADKYDRLAQSLIAIKGADYARDMAAAKLAGGSGEVIDGETDEPPREKKPRPKPAARKPEPTSPTPAATKTEPARAAGFGRGFFAKWWRGK